MDLGSSNLPSSPPAKGHTHCDGEARRGFSFFTVQSLQVAHPINVPRIGRVGMMAPSRGPGHNLTDIVQAVFGSANVPPSKHKVIERVGPRLTSHEGKFGKVLTACRLQANSAWQCQLRGLMDVRWGSSSPSTAGPRPRQADLGLSLAQR